MTVEAPPVTTEPVQNPVGAVGRDFWSGIGIDISEAQDADDVFRLAPELDFTVQKAPLTATVTGNIETGDDFPTVQTDSVAVPGWVATVRTDTNAVLGVVSEQWQNYQNKQLTEFAEAMRGEIDAPYERALVLFDGRVVALELTLGGDMFLPGDPSPWKNRALIWTGHDGRHALNIQRIKQRIFCANQFSSVTGNAIATFKVRHTKNMAVNLKDVYAALNMVAQYDKTFEEAMAAMTASPMDSNHMADFAVELLPIPENTKNPIRTINARDAITDLFTASETLEGVDFTAYRAFQAVGEYVDHYRTYRTPKNGTANDGRAVSIIEGSAATLKKRAFQLLTA